MTEVFTTSLRSNNLGKMILQTNGKSIAFRLHFAVSVKDVTNTRCSVIKLMQFNHSLNFYAFLLFILEANANSR